MKCPHCAYDNKPDALVCNLCQSVLRRSHSAAPAVSSARGPVPHRGAIPTSRDPFRSAPHPTPENASISRVPVPPPEPARWGKSLVVLLWALLLLGFGAKLCITRWREVSLSETPRSISAGEALAFQGPGIRHIRIAAAADVDPRVIFRRYRSSGGVSFSGRDPRQPLVLDQAAEILARKDLLGAEVTYTGPSYSLTYLTLTTKQDERVRGVRVYLPIHADRLWVISDVFPAVDSPGVTEFLARRSHTGVLRPIDRDESLWKAYTEHGAKKPPPGALGIYPRTAAPEKIENLTVWVPVAALGYRLWLVCPDGKPIPGDAMQEGILEVVDPDDVRALSRRVTEAIGANVLDPNTSLRAIVLTTPDEYRSLRQLPATAHRLGLWCLGAGGVLLAVFALRARTMLRG